HRVARVERALAPGLLEHVARDAILGGSARVEELELAPDRRPRRVEPYRNERRGSELGQEPSVGRQRATGSAGHDLSTLTPTIGGPADGQRCHVLSAAQSRMPAPAARAPC